ncbi:hypothetical protein Q1695_007193 [Nippostrongylus brasiliensis]|nr:hypothetical protein Q1695_007193 [Nippostrongylus brasiliensis]
MSGTTALLVAIVGIVAVNAHPRGLFGHPSPPPCGLPPFTDDLPKDAQEKLKEIWKDYKEGEKCYNEHGLTRELIDSLPKDVRQKIHRGLFVPPVLKKAPKDVQDQFNEILKNKAIPFDQKPAKMHELAQKVLKGDLLEEFNKFHDKVQENVKKVADLASKLSPEAKEAYEKISKLEKEKHDIMHSLSDKAQEELLEVFRQKHMKPL